MQPRRAALPGQRWLSLASPWPYPEGAHSDVDRSSAACFPFKEVVHGRHTRLLLVRVWEGPGVRVHRPSLMAHAGDQAPRVTAAQFSAAGPDSTSLQTEHALWWR